MCMMAPMPQQQQLKQPPPIEPGPASPQDKVNDQAVENINDPSMQEYHQNKNKGKQASGQSSSKTNKAY